MSERDSERPLLRTSGRFRATPRIDPRRVPRKVDPQMVVDPNILAALAWAVAAREASLGRRRGSAHTRSVVSSVAVVPLYALPSLPALASSPSLFFGLPLPPVFPSSHSHRALPSMHVCLGEVVG